MNLPFMLEALLLFNIFNRVAEWGRF